MSYCFWFVWCTNFVTIWTNLWYNHRMIFYKTSCNWECFCIYFEISGVYYSFYIFQVSYLYTEKSLMLLNYKWNFIIIKWSIFNDYFDENQGTHFKRYHFLHGKEICFFLMFDRMEDFHVSVWSIQLGSSILCFWYVCKRHHDQYAVGFFQDGKTVHSMANFLEVCI